MHGKRILEIINCMDFVVYNSLMRSIVNYATKKLAGFVKQDGSFLSVLFPAD